MMMAYGLFVFRLETAPYQSLQRQMQWRHPAQGRVGLRPARQYLGPGDDQITLAGTLLPQLTGGQLSIEALRALGDGGRAWPLIEGTGYNYGAYVVTGLSEDKSTFFHDGAASRIDFELTLVRVDGDTSAVLGTLTPADVANLVTRSGLAF